MSARAVLRWISGLMLALGFLGLLGRFLDENWITLAAPLVLVTLGFFGVLALFLKD